LCEARKASCEPKTIPAKVISIKKSNSASCEASDKSLDSVSCETKIVFDYEIISALHKAKPHLSREAKAKSPLGASSEATLASSALLGSTTEALSLNARAKAPYDANSEAITASKVLSCKARTKAPIGANNEVSAASLKSKALLNSAKLASSSNAKAQRAQAASPCVACLQSEAILASPTSKKRSFKAKLMALLKYTYRGGE